MHKSQAQKRIIVRDYKNEDSARAILKMLEDGSFHSTKGLPDKAPFSEYTQTGEEELSGYKNPDGSPNLDAQEKYIEKKRRIPLQQFAALKMLGMARIKSRTTSATYALTPFGMDILRGLRIVQEAHRRNITLSQVWRTLFPDKSTPELFDDV